jgi:hypothetical protein
MGSLGKHSGPTHTNGACLEILNNVPMNIPNRKSNIITVLIWYNKNRIDTDSFSILSHVSALFS